MNHAPFMAASARDSKSIRFLSSIPRSTGSVRASIFNPAGQPVSVQPAANNLAYRTLLAVQLLAEVHYMLPHAFVATLAFLTKVSIFASPLGSIGCAHWCVRSPQDGGGFRPGCGWDKDRSPGNAGPADEPSASRLQTTGQRQICILGDAAGDAV